jgi:hypothetical protein
MTSAWPLQATPEDDMPLPAPWSGDVDLRDRHTDALLVQLSDSNPALVLRVCRNVFCSAEARDDKHAALIALHVACVALYNASRNALGNSVLALVIERARDVGAADLNLLTRIEINRARRLCDTGEHAEAMIIRQRALDSAMALAEPRMIVAVLGGLSASAFDAGDAELTLSLCEQQGQWLIDGDAGTAIHLGVRSNNMAVAWMKIAQVRATNGDHASARAARESAKKFALSACEAARGDRELLHHLETLVQALLELEESAEARAHFVRVAARLAEPPMIGSNPWCNLELARARIDIHDGRVSTQTLDKLLEVEALVERVRDDHKQADLIREVMQLAQERLGLHDQALASHKRVTEWWARRSSAQTRQRIKMLRHAVMAMQAEAVEFITHDLLTPLAAAQTWAQALLYERLSTASAQPLRDAHALLADATALSDQCLGLWRSELTPRDQLGALDLGALADDVCENFDLPWLPRRVRLERDLRIGACIQGDRISLTRALTALLFHAVHRADEGTVVRLRLWVEADGKGEKVVLSVEFQGLLPPPAVRTRIFQRFADGAVVSAGELGWLLVARVAQLHRARLRFNALAADGNSMQLTFGLSTMLHDGADL